ncbi:hypothetical protein XELAEV_18044376mg [Xenopus laevis]|uniref:Uncharacterized protein n=1 Tax=Xenopus laevis TaxID=8355 RepID=A0A974BYP0_XENLA|nr:hypothetical protein XELAEV_18044376mg [Xenopus laevis]
MEPIAISASWISQCHGLVCLDSQQAECYENKSLDKRELWKMKCKISVRASTTQSNCLCTKNPTAFPWAVVSLTHNLLPPSGQILLNSETPRNSGYQGFL